MKEVLAVQYNQTVQPMQRAWVVFTDNCELKMLRFLKHGFRHCYVLLHDGKHWIACDPLAHIQEITVPQVPYNFDLPNWLSEQGQTVLPVKKKQAPKRPAPLMFFTCVESVKRSLGIHKRSILTPWQLYKYLLKNNQERN